MNTIIWKYIRPLTKEALNETQNSLGVVFPTSYTECVLHNNGGRPTPSTFDYPNQQGAVFQRLLPVAAEDRYGILFTMDALSDRLAPGYVPFASDPFGNYLCFRYPAGKDVHIFFWDHEKGSDVSPVPVCDGFDALLRSLY